MPVGTESRPPAVDDHDRQMAPRIAVCEGAPGRSVFLEAENSDGWIATDTTIPVEQ